MLDRGQDRCRVVLRVIDHEVVAQTWCNDECRESSAGTPDIVRAGCAALAGRRHMVPLSAKLVIRDYDHGVVTAATALNGLEQADQVIAAADFAGVARVLVVLADWFHEADRLQLALPWR